MEQETGERPKALEKEPGRLSRKELEFLDAYYLVASTRSCNDQGAPGPLMLSEIKAFIDICGDYSFEEALRLVIVIKKLDAEFLNYQARKSND